MKIWNLKVVIVPLIVLELIQILYYVSAALLISFLLPKVIVLCLFLENGPQMLTIANELSTLPTVQNVRL